MDLTPEIKEKLIAQLNYKFTKDGAVSLKCPMCGNQQFVLVEEGFTARDISRNYEQRQIGGQGIPSISIICTNCGYIADFSIGVLGLLTNTPKNPDSKTEQATEMDPKEK